MFSINFESDLVLLHSRTTSDPILSTLAFRKHRNSVRTAERIIHQRLKLCTIKCGPNEVETIHLTGACINKENSFLYWVNVFLSDVNKIGLFRFYPETQSDMWVLVLENTFSNKGWWSPLVSVPRHSLNTVFRTLVWHDVIVLYQTL